MEVGGFRAPGPAEKSGLDDDPRVPRIIQEGDRTMKRLPGKTCQRRRCHEMLSRQSRKAENQKNQNREDSRAHD